MSNEELHNKITYGTTYE